MTLNTLLPRNEDTITVTFEEIDNGLLQDGSPIQSGHTIRHAISICKHKAVKIESVNVYLEGTSRVWVRRGDHVETMQHVFQFLKQVQMLDNAAAVMNEAALETSHSFPVFFLLPTSPVSEQRAGLADSLPPSVGFGPSYLDYHNRRYRQPLIEYRLRAVVRYRCSHLLEETQESVQACKDLDLQRCVALDMPPSYSKHDLPENETTAVVVTQSKLVRRKIAKLSATIIYLRDLSFQLDGDSMTGGCIIRLRYNSSSSTRQQQNPPPISVTCNIKLVSVVQFGTRPLAKREQIGPVDNVHWRCRREAIYAKSMRSTNVPWSPVHDQESNAHVTEIMLPIALARPLLQPFSTPLASLSYMIQITVKLDTLHHRELVVEAPIDVVLSPQPEGSPIEGSELDGASEGDESTMVAPPPYDGCA